MISSLIRLAKTAVRSGESAYVGRGRFFTWGDLIMLALVSFLLLGQFEASKNEAIGVERYATLCEEHNREVAERRFAQRGFKEASKLGYAKLSPQGKRAYNAKKAEHAKLEKELKTVVDLKDLPLMVNELKVDGIGALMESVSSPVVIPNGRGGTTRVASYSLERAGLTVVDVINDQMLLVRSGGDPFGLIPEPGHNATDGAAYDAKGVYVVVGRFTYTNVGGGKSTVPVVQQWKHQKEWDEKRDEIKAKREEELKKASAPAKKKPAVKK